MFEYQNSQRKTSQLKQKILDQTVEYSIDKEKEKEVERVLRKERDERNEAILKSLRENMSVEEIRANDVAQKKGASAWLTALPLKDEGFVLNKREFFDALAIRYRWPLKRLPSKCVCGNEFSMTHAMNCKRGGYIGHRHNKN